MGKLKLVSGDILLRWGKHLPAAARATQTPTVTTHWNQVTNSGASKLESFNWPLRRTLLMNTSEMDTNLGVRQTRLFVNRLNKSTSQQVNKPSSHQGKRQCTSRTPPPGRCPNISSAKSPSHSFLGFYPAGKEGSFSVDLSNAPLVTDELTSTKDPGTRQWHHITQSGSCWTQMFAEKKKAGYKVKQSEAISRLIYIVCAVSYSTTVHYSPV